MATSQGELSSLESSESATLQWQVDQGIEMRRPSRLYLTAERREGTTAEVRVAGGAIVICRGTIEAPPAG